MLCQTYNEVFTLMITLLRKIRYRHLLEGRLSKYGKYAVGEILLVVAGILIALQLNNWNEQRIQQNKINDYYVKLLQEVEEKISYTNKRLAAEQTLFDSIESAIEILANERRDKAAELNTHLGAISTDWPPSYDFPVFDEFIAQGLLSKIEKDSIKTLLVVLKNQIQQSRVMDIYTSNQYSRLIEPFFAENINYANVALPQYKTILIQGGPATDTEWLFSSLKLWNVATFKLETTSINILRYQSMKTVLEKLKTDLEALNLKEN
jgi:hypothetical protein